VKKTNNKRIALGIGIVLVVLAAYTSPAAADADVYFDPDPSTIGIGETATIQLMWHVDANECGARSFQIGIDFDPSVVNITEVSNPYLFSWGGTDYYQWDVYFSHIYRDDPVMAPMGGGIWTTGSHPACYDSPTTVPIGNFTMVGVSAGTCPLIFTFENRAVPSIMYSALTNCTDEIDDDRITWTNGKVGCIGGTCYANVDFTGTATENVTCKDCIGVLGLSWQNYEFESPCAPGIMVPRRNYTYCPECCDGTDNDTDGFIDWPADPQCKCCLDETEDFKEGCPGECVPELATVTFVSVGLLGLIGAIWRRRYD